MGGPTVSTMASNNSVPMKGLRRNATAISRAVLFDLRVAGSRHDQHHGQIEAGHRRMQRELQAGHASQMNVGQQAGGAQARGGREEFLGAGERFAAVTGDPHDCRSSALRTQRGFVVDDGDGLSVAVACSSFPDSGARYTGPVTRAYCCRSANYLCLAATAGNVIPAPGHPRDSFA